MYSRLSDKISQFIQLEPSDNELIKSVFHILKVEKGARLISNDSNTQIAYFINSGYLKYSKMTDEGEELVIHIYSPGDFAASLNNFFLGQKSQEELHCITDSQLLYISRSDLERLYTSNPKWESFGRRLMEFFLAEKEQRIISQISLPASQRYEIMMKEHPDIIQNVPVKYIASFIGVKPESLSRIRKSIN